MDIRSKISLLWVFVLLNMIYADIISLMDPTSALRLAIAKDAADPTILFIAALLMETSISMVLLSRILGKQPNRIINISVCAINIVAVIGAGQGWYYAFFAGIETIAMLLIAWLAWAWQDENTSNLIHQPQTTI